MTDKEMYFSYEWRYKKEDLKFCPRCGSKFNLQDIHIKNQPQLVCHNCKFIFYLDPKLAVVAFITYEDKVLLLKRAEAPGVGLWAFPGGHVERGVNLFTAIKNEIHEETGLDVEIDKIIETFCFGDTIQLVYKAKSKNDKIKINIESQEGKFFNYSDIPWDKLAFESTGKILKNYFS
jgi:ADP-ribose pyrophosphatase YjhB (NUDIX family)